MYDKCSNKTRNLEFSIIEGWLVGYLLTDCRLVSEKLNLLKWNALVLNFAQIIRLTQIQIPVYYKF